MDLLLEICSRSRDLVKNEHQVQTGLYKIQKKSIKELNTRIFVQTHFLKCSPMMSVFILKYEKNDIIFFIPLVSDLPEIEECLHLTTAMVCNSFQKWILWCLLITHFLMLSIILYGNYIIKNEEEEEEVNVRKKFVNFLGQNIIYNIKK